MPDTYAIAEIQNEDGSKMYRVPFRARKKEVVMQNGDKQPGSMSILDAVRGAVDNNFKRIHEIIADKLYNTLGVTPRELYKVERYTRVDINGNPKIGYLYNYNKQRGEYVYSGIRVDVDDQGNVIDAIETK
jgi:hypothetical protein